jgi:acyl-CoA synthetase (AMP-forming)/AMP-acid ligase II
MLPELAVFSGDTVETDEDGFLYFIGRRDEMIKSSGYRISPVEVEDTVYATGLVAEAVAFGVPHPRLGDAIVMVVTAEPGSMLDLDALHSECKSRFPGYMVPSHIESRTGPLPRNPNGKIDRKALSSEFLTMFENAALE